MIGHTARRLQDPSEVQPFVLPAQCRELLHFVALLVGQRLLPDQASHISRHQVPPLVASEPDYTRCSESMDSVARERPFDKEHGWDFDVLSA